jgi:hypothetical protein
VGNPARHSWEIIMSESALAFTIEQLGEQAAACTGFDQIAYAIEFTRRVDQLFPRYHPERLRAVELAKPAGYLVTDPAVEQA